MRLIISNYWKKIFSPYVAQNVEGSPNVHKRLWTLWTFISQITSCIGLYDLIGGADTLEKHTLQMIFDNDPVEDIVSSLPSSVCGVKDCYKNN